MSLYSACPAPQAPNMLFLHKWPVMPLGLLMASLRNSEEILGRLDKKPLSDILILVCSLVITSRKYLFNAPLALPCSRLHFANASITTGASFTGALLLFSLGNSRALCSASLPECVRVHPASLMPQCPAASRSTFRDPLASVFPSHCLGDCCCCLRATGHGSLFSSSQRHGTKWSFSPAGLQHLSPGPVFGNRSLHGHEGSWAAASFDWVPSGSPAVPGCEWPRGRPAVNEPPSPHYR